jgi:hypothetical protein
MIQISYSPVSTIETINPNLNIILQTVTRKALTVSGILKIDCGTVGEYLYRPNGIFLVVFFTAHCDGF